MEDTMNTGPAQPGPTPAEERAKATLARASEGAFAGDSEGSEARPGATPAEIRALDAIGAAMEAGMPLEQAARLATRVGPACEALTQLSQRSEARAFNPGAAEKKPLAPGK